MAFDPHKNFAYSTVAVAPSPTTTGNTLTVQPGDGVKFPNVPFNATACPPGNNPTLANAEIIRVTDVTGDVLTFSRTQEGTSAQSINTGWQIGNSITAKTLTDIEGAINNSSTTKGFAIAMAVGLS